MAGIKLWGWDDTNSKWVRVQVNPDGKLIVNPTALFEDTPSDGEMGKGPTSNWAHDHAAAANVHHTPPVAGDFQHNNLAGIGAGDHHDKYTDGEAQGAVQDWALHENIREYWNVASYNSTSDPATGALVITLPKSWSNTMMTLELMIYEYLGNRGGKKVIIGGYTYGGGTQWVMETAFCVGYMVNRWVRFGHDGSKCCIVLGETTSKWRFIKVILQRFMAGATYTTGWQTGWTIEILDDLTGYTFTGDINMYDMYYLPAPASGETRRAITAGWAYDHAANADAHHAKYTDAAAIAAVEGAPGLDFANKIELSGGFNTPNGIYNSSSVTQDYVFNALNAFILNVDDEMRLSGAVFLTGYANMAVVTKAERKSDTLINIHTMQTNGSYYIINITEGNTDDVFGKSNFWW